MPEVSIITPCYNGARYLGGTIDSVLQQSLQDFEYVIVDDGSIDNSARIAQEYVVNDERIKLVQQPNGHMSNARNNGYRTTDRASKYLMFLDADDCLEPEALFTMVSYMNERPLAGLAYCSRTIVGANDEIIDAVNVHTDTLRRYTLRGIWPALIPCNVAPTPLFALISRHYAIPSACLFRRSVFEKTRFWDETLRRAGEDHDMVLQMALFSEVHLIPLQLLRYRIHSSNASTKGEPGLRDFHKKWWDSRDINERQRVKVRHALLFDQYLNALIMLKVAAQELTRGRWRKALRASYRAMGMAVRLFFWFARYVTDQVCHR